MKNSKFRCVIPMALLFVSLVINTGCQREAIEANSPTVSAKVQELLDLSDGTSSSPDDKEFEKFQSMYQALSEEELVEFLEFEARNFSKLNPEIQPGPTEQGIQEYVSQLRETNKLSRKLFNKQFNHLNPSELNTLFETIEPLPNGPSTETCTAYSFPLRGTSTSYYNTSCNSVNFASSLSDPTDCDYQLRFPSPNACFGSIYVKPIGPIASTIVQTYGGIPNLTFRSTSSNVYLLLGNRGVDYVLFYLTPSARAQFVKTYFKILM
jgi:hypothetical protein